MTLDDKVKEVATGYLGTPIGIYMDYIFMRGLGDCYKLEDYSLENVVPLTSMLSLGTVVLYHSLKFILKNRQ